MIIHHCTNSFCCLFLAVCLLHCVQLLDNMTGRILREVFIVCISWMSDHNVTFLTCLLYVVREHLTSCVTPGVTMFVFHAV